MHSKPHPFRLQLPRPLILLLNREAPCSLSSSAPTQVTAPSYSIQMVSGIDLQPYLSVTSIPLFAIVQSSDGGETDRQGSVGVSPVTSPVVKAALVQVRV